MGAIKKILVVGIIILVFLISAPIIFDKIFKIQGKEETYTPQSEEIKMINKESLRKFWKIVQGLGVILGIITTIFTIYIPYKEGRDHQKIIEESLQSIQLDISSGLFDKAFGRIVALENKFNGSEKPDIIADLEHKKGVCYYNFSQRANANENTRDENLNNALISFNKALKVFTKEKYPTQYASTNTNIGVIYATFSKYKNRVENSKESISYFKKALEIHKDDNVSYDYAKIQINLGASYGTLAMLGVDKETNFINSIISFEEALRFFTLEKYPYQYAFAKCNLGVAHSNLNDLPEGKKYLYLALDEFNESLKVYTIEKYPGDYANILFNLAVTHRRLSFFENPLNNLKIALGYCEDSLLINTFERNKESYGSIKITQGAIYRRLSEIDNQNKEQYLINALDAYSQALILYKIYNEPYQYALIYGNIGNVYIEFSKIKDKQDNVIKAIEAFDEALKIFTPENYPSDYYRTIKNKEMAQVLLIEE